MRKKKSYPPYMLLFLLFFITFAYFFQGGGWNQNSRLCLTRAMLHQGVFSIDGFKEDASDPYYEFVNTGDWSYYKGHYYTVRPPGLSFMAYAPFGIAEFLLQKLFPENPELQVHLSAYISTVCTVSLFAALLCLLLFYLLNSIFAFPNTRSLILTIFFGFGTYAFAYSTSFYSYLPASFFGFLAFVLLLSIKINRIEHKKTIVMIAGCAASLAVLLEASTALILVCVLGYCVTLNNGRNYLAYFLFGCIPCGALQLLYNTACFGGPFNVSYDYANPVVMWYIEGRLFSIPTLSDFLGVLVLPYRGLFFSSPVLIFAPVGILIFFKKKLWRREALVCSTVTLAYILMFASYNAWHGGTTVGPRYLVPAFPFIFLLSAGAFSLFPKSFTIIGLVSVLINFSIVTVGNEILINISNPLFDVILKKIAAGQVSINPVPFSHFHNYSNWLLFTAIEKWPQNFNSFNIGEIIFPYSIVSLLPLFIFWMIWGFFWCRNTKQQSVNYP